MPTIASLRSARKPYDRAPTMAELRQRIAEQSRALVSLAMDTGSAPTTFRMFERELRECVFDLACTIIGLFITRPAERVQTEAPTALFAINFAYS